MAATSIKGGLWIPDIPDLVGAPAFNTLSTMNATGLKVAVAILQIPATGTITAVGYRVGTMTTSDSIDVGIYTVDSSGNPTTTAYGGMTTGNNGSVSFNTGGAATLTQNTYYTITLGTSCSATAGDVVAVVISFTAYSAGNFVIQNMAASSGRSMMPYQGTFNGTTWSKAAVTTAPLVSLEYSGAAYNYIPGAYPFSALTTTAYNSGTGVDNEYGLSFQLPVPATLAGIAFNLAAAAGATFDVDFYSTGTTVGTSFSVTGNQAAATSAGMWYFAFPTPQALSANTTYRVSLRPTNTTSITLTIPTYPKAAALDQMGGGQNFVLCSRNGGAWDADSTTKRPQIYLNFSKFDDGAGAGGGAILSRVQTGF